MGNERRHSFRCKVDAESAPTQGVLHTTRGDVNVRLENRSCGGFGVSLPAGSKIHIKTDEELAFSFQGASVLVRVAHFSESAEGIVVGLQMLRELPKQLRANHGKRRFARTPKSSLSFRVCLYGSALAIAAMVVPWGYLLMALETGMSNQQQLHAAQSRTSRLLLPQGEQQPHAYLALAFFQFNQLRTPQMAQYLQLSATQQQDIGRIVQETSMNMESLYQQHQADDPAEWTEAGLNLLFASARQVEALLTEQQLAAWNKLLQESADERSGGS